MKIRGLALATAFLMIVSATGAVAGKGDSFQNWADGDRAGKKVYFGPAHASMKHFKSIGMPKRVGLLSFYLFDRGSIEFSAMAATYGGTYMKSFGLNERGANTFSSELAKLGVPALKKQFAARGMELLLPIEFLDSEEKKRAYLDFELPKGSLQKFAASIMNWLDQNPKASGAADGFEMIPTHLWTDRDILRAIDELRVALGLDAVAVLANTTTSSPSGISLGSIMLQIYGPNPVPLPDNKMQAKYWTPGIQYINGTFGKGFKGVAFVSWKKGENATARYEGYGAMLESITKATLDELQGKNDRGK